MSVAEQRGVALLVGQRPQCLSADDSRVSLGDSEFRGGTKQRGHTYRVAEGAKFHAAVLDSAIAVPYTLYFRSIAKRSGLVETAEAETAADAVRRMRELTASDHVVTLIIDAEGQRVAREDLEAIAKAERPILRGPL